MDKLLGSIIDDYTLYRVIEGIITILILVAVYLGIQIILMWRSLNNTETNPDKVISNKASFFRSSIFIFIAGFFMLIHNFLESLDTNEPDFATYESFELLALLGMVLFLNEWHKILKKLRKKQS
jgi:uncharacterized membrane protein